MADLVDMTFYALAIQYLVDHAADITAYCRGAGYARGIDTDEINQAGEAVILLVPDDEITEFPVLLLQQCHYPCGFRIQVFRFNTGQGIKYSGLDECFSERIVYTIIQLIHIVEERPQPQSPVDVITDMYVHTNCRRRRVYQPVDKFTLSIADTVIHSFK